MTENQTRLLVVEDEPTIARAVADRLAAEGFAVDVAGDGPSAVERARAFEPHLIVLDVMLPGFDGLEVCRRVQASRPVPVLMLTARDDETDLLVGLGVGADDYVTKPFSMRELVARVRAVLRRVDRPPASALKDDAVRIGPLEVDQRGRRVRLDGSEVHLTPTEFDLLACLLRNRGTVLTRAVLLEQVWNWADASGTRVVDSHVKALRRKLGQGLIRTVHGVGYSLDTAS
ncbi:DNA-binding response OmpR family regulator [Actinomadura pelletieri DSM 43383]|uniref:DNA-binding response OmpR family regulator n=1 Tax=Actinomadura pelletieri DSM 43383 TaxID=1120940 RepID=A0A495QYL2_9ACTN|nr:response regulator transcription factor [Actinomadura pelletieri]RKS79114.1 DNA-binding response OmpR family regulator [Actinomadura pelletieri DSM 43383]